MIEDIVDRYIFWLIDNVPTYFVVPLITLTFGTPIFLCALLLTLLMEASW